MFSGLLPAVRTAFLSFKRSLNLVTSGRCGAAYYDPIKCMIYVLEDTQETTHYELTTMRTSAFLFSDLL
jgi:hypothetical protein